MLEPKYLQRLQQNSWFSQLATVFKDLIIQPAIQPSEAKQELFFHLGDIFDGLYAGLAGAVRLGYIDIEGNQSVVAMVEAIMWFGEISLVDAQPRSHDATCITKSLILHVPRSAIQNLLEQRPIFWYHIAQWTSHKPGLAFLELISIQTQSISQHLAQRLIFILNG